MRPDTLAAELTVRSFAAMFAVPASFAQASAVDIGLHKAQRIVVARWQGAVLRAVGVDIQHVPGVARRAFGGLVRVAVCAGVRRAVFAHALVGSTPVHGNTVGRK